jgi:hypothetical protein
VAPGLPGADHDPARAVGERADAEPLVPPMEASADDGSELGLSPVFLFLYLHSFAHGALHLDSHYRIG